MRFGMTSVAVFVLAAIAAVRPASAICSNATLNGAYGYYHGRQGGGGGGSTIKNLVGQIVADGQGSVSGSWTLSLNGTISAGAFTGTYSIARNCTGSLTLNNEDSSPAHFSIVVDDGHHGFQMIQTDNGSAQPGFGLAQGTAACGLPGKKQTFATNLLGFLFSTSQTEAIVGQVTLDGKGNISGSETFSIGGTISTVPVKGTYTQNTDCTGTLQIAPSGFVTANFNTVVVNGGKEMLLIETDNTTLVAGIAQQ